MKGEKENEDDDDHDLDDDSGTDVLNDKMKKEKLEKGNSGKAYGKNKDDMSGKEFGQYRATVAKEKMEATDQTFNEKEELLRQGREKVKKAKERVAKQRAEKTADEAVLQEKEEKIRKAEEKLNELDGVIKKGREKMKEKKEQIEQVMKPVE